jgi:RimJ/RimL family protein N-acetyltransferase
MVTVRPAVSADARLLFEWRNDPATRAASLTQDEIGWPEHVAWFERSLESSTRCILLAVEDDRSVGMVRFDISPDDGSAEVSINLAPEVRGTGRSRAILDAGIAAFVEEHDVTVLTAQIRAANVASARLFVSTGFTPLTGDVDDEVDTYRRELDLKP